MPRFVNCELHLAKRPLLSKTSTPLQPTKAAEEIRRMIDGATATAAARLVPLKVIATRDFDGGGPQAPSAAQLLLLLPEPKSLPVLRLVRL